MGLFSSSIIAHNQPRHANKAHLTVMTVELHWFLVIKASKNNTLKNFNYANATSAVSTGNNITVHSKLEVRVTKICTVL